MTARAILLLLCCALLGSSSGCKSSEHQLRSMYKETMRDQRQMKSIDDFEARAERDGIRRGRVRQLVEDERLRTADEHFYAAVILVTSDDVSDLQLAQNVAMKARDLGAQRAPAVVAEATDKMLMRQGLPQRFGTQYIYDPLLARWQLYDLSPATTDADRESMGIPPLAVLQERAEYLNATQEGRRK